jgi:hypothetical protein
MRYPKFQHRARGLLRAVKMTALLVQAGRGTRRFSDCAPPQAAANRRILRH